MALTRTRVVGRRTSAVDDEASGVGRDYGAKAPVSTTAAVDAQHATRLKAIPAVLLVLAVMTYLVSGLWQAAHDSPTVDEVVDISSGTATLVHHDLRMNPEHAFLPKIASALPALLAHPVVPHGDSWQSGDWFGYADDFVRANRAAGTLDRVLFLARLVPLAEGLGCAWLIFLLGRRLFRATAGAAGAALWLSTPVVVGLSHFAGVDIAFTLATLAVAYRVLLFVDEPGGSNAAVLGGCCAAALLTRHSAFSLWAYAVVVVVAVVWRSDRRVALRYGAMVVLVGFAGVWIATRAIAPAGPSPEFAARSSDLIAEASARSVFARTALAVPLPTEYRAGLAYLVVTSVDRPAYLFGHAWNGSRVWYFPGVVVAKLPLGALVSMAMASLGLVRVRQGKRRRVMLAVVGPALVSFAFVVAQPLNLGVRYVMPSLALLFVGAGAVVARAVSRPQRALVAAVGCAQAAAMIGAGAHALAWTAPPFRPAYRAVSDSNLDYGQDNGRVEAWAREHPQAWVTLLRPRGYDLPAGTRELRGADVSQVRGWIAVSATRLTALDREQLSWLRAYCPLGDVGGSVLLYRLASAPDTAPGPVMPVKRCAVGADFSTRA